MDFLSTKSLEGILRMTFHVVNYREEGGDRGGHAWEIERDRQTIALRDKERNTAELEKKKNSKGR